MQKSRTVQLDKGQEIDFMVLEYSCRDSSVLSSLGKHCKESLWKIAVGVDSVPITIKLSVDKQVASAPEVSVFCNDQKVFPETSASRSKLKEDFQWRMPFRGTVKGLAMKDFFEVRPEYLGQERWFLATLTEQREDGLFKAILQMPDGKGGFNSVDFPAVKVENLREAFGAKRPISLPQRYLELYVPMKHPLDASLRIDGEAMTHFFSRPTPPPTKQGNGRSRVLFSVSKDRSTVVADVGHSALGHFLSGGVRSVRQSADKLKKTWEFQVGPFAQHVVEIEKKYKSSNLISLTVDGTLLAESTGEDIESRQGFWECGFRLVGERFMDWEVYESDGTGFTLDTKGTVVHRSKFSHECIISFQEADGYLTAANLWIDELDFVELEQAKPAHNEENIACALRGLSGSYGLTAPFKVSEGAQLRGGFQWQNLTSLAAQGRGVAVPSGFFSFFELCCSNAPHVELDANNISIQQADAYPRTS